MKNIFRKVVLILVVTLVLLPAFGCVSDNNEIKPGEEIIVSGFVSEKAIESEENYITFHILKTPEGETTNLKLNAATKEDYDYFAEDNFYIISYGKDSLEIKSYQLNNPLGEAVVKGIGLETDKLEETPILATEKSVYEDYSLLDSYLFDINEDGVEETIALYTAAQRDSNGEIAWDDGQKWVLVVQGKDKDYELYNNYVQLGGIKLYIFTTDDGFHIATMENTTAGLKLVDYTFNKEEKSFIPKIHYNVPGNVNMLYISNGY